MNQSQARNWNQATRLALMDGSEWCGIVAPDTVAQNGWLTIANDLAESDYHLIGHLNFSVFRADTIRKLGWFDERMTSGGAEDYDMYCRLEEAGILYDRFVFSYLRCEVRGNMNQYRDTPERAAQQKKDAAYWHAKWSDGRDFTDEQMMADIRKRRRNWPELDWYPSVLDRDLVK